MNNYNGCNGCGFCNQRGEKCGIVDKFIFPYVPLSQRPYRTKEETEQIYARIIKRKMDFTSDSNKHIEGIKDIPVFAQILPYWSMTEQITVEVMHNVALGLVKTLIKCWRSPKVSTCSRNHNIILH